MSNSAPIAMIAPTIAAQATPDDAGNPVAMTAAASTSSALAASVVTTAGAVANSSTDAFAALIDPLLQADPSNANAHAASIAALIANYKRRNREHERELNIILQDVWTTRQRLAWHGYDLINQCMYGAAEISPAVRTLLGALALAEYFRQEVLWDLIGNDKDWKNVELSEVERLDREARVGLERRGSGL